MAVIYIDDHQLVQHMRSPSTVLISGVLFSLYKYYNLEEILMHICSMSLIKKFGIQFIANIIDLVQRIK